jgi:tRNA (guanine9-N1)-methyltransferase
MVDDNNSPLQSGTSEVLANTATSSTIQSRTIKAPQLSKNAQKRALKQEKWDSLRDARRENRKEKLKEKKTKMKLAGERLPPRKKPPIEGQENSGVKVVIDCAFDDWMNDKVRAYHSVFLHFCILIDE